MDEEMSLLPSLEVRVLSAALCLMNSKRSAAHRGKSELPPLHAWCGTAAIASTHPGPCNCETRTLQDNGAPPLSVASGACAPSGAASATLSKLSRAEPCTCTLVAAVPVLGGAAVSDGCGMPMVLQGMAVGVRHCC